MRLPTFCAAHPVGWPNGSQDALSKLARPLDESPVGRFCSDGFLLRIDLAAPGTEHLMRLRYEITIDDLMAFNLHVHETSPTIRRSRRSGIIAFAVVILGLCLLAYKQFRNPIIFAFGVGAAGLFAVIHPLLYRHNLKRISSRLYAESQNKGFTGEQVSELRDIGLSHANAFAERTVFWKGIERIETIPGRTLVYFSAASAQVIPEDSVVEGSYPAFVAELQRRWQNATGL